MTAKKANSKSTVKNNNSTAVKEIDLQTINKNVRKALAKRKANKS